MQNGGNDADDKTQTVPVCAGCGRALRQPGSTARPMIPIDESGAPSAVPVAESKEQQYCPDCGMPVAISLGSAGSALGVDDKGNVTGDIICRKCGYNLRGLHRDGRCPECAAPVSLSARQDFLCFAEPGYVSRLARGGYCVYSGLLALAIVVIALLAILAAFASSMPSESGFIAIVAVVLATTGLLAGALLVLCGVWMVSTGEPRTDSPASLTRARHLIRVSLLLGLLAILLHYSLPQLNPPMSIMAAFMAVGLGLKVLGVIGVRTYFRLVSAVSDQVPDPRLSKQATDLGRNLTVILSVLLLVDVVATAIAWRRALWTSTTVTPPMPATPPGLAFLSVSSGPIGVFWIGMSTCAVCVAQLALLLSFFAVLRFHRAFSTALKHQATLASQHWQAASHEH